MSVSAFLPLESETEVTDTSHTTFGVQPSVREGGSERELGTPGAGGRGGGAEGGGDRAADTPNVRNQQQQQRQYRRRKTHSPAPSRAVRALTDPSIAELQQRSERVAEMTASNHR